MVAIAVIFPLQRELAVPGLGRVNLSIGDPIVGLVLIAALGYAVVGRRFRLHRYTRPVLLFCGVALLSFTAALLSGVHPVSVGSGLSNLIKLVGAAAWGLAGVTLFSSDTKRRVFLFTWTFALVALCFAVVSIFEEVVLGVTRPRGPFDHTNLYANYLAFGFFSLWASSKISEEAGLRSPFRRFRPLLTTFAGLVLALAIVATASRGMLLGMLVGGVFTFRAWRPEGLTKRQLVVAGLLLIGIAGAYFAQSPFIIQRVAGFFVADSTIATSGGEQVRGLSLRMLLWTTAVQVFFDSPVLGVGYGQIPVHMGLRAGYPIEAHQTFLTIAAEMGLIGILVFAWILGRVVRDALAGTSVASRVFLGYILATLAQGLVTNVDQYRLLWLSIAVVGMLATRSSTVARSPVRMLRRTTTFRSSTES